MCASETFAINRVALEKRRLTARLLDGRDPRVAPLRIAAKNRHLRTRTSQAFRQGAAKHAGGPDDNGHFRGQIE
jgi:hypothetical protein